MQPRLVLLEPPAAQREFKLTLPTTIGRSREAKLKLVHGQVSRVHCEFFERDGLLYVRDLGSTNGTFVGNARIEEAPVWPGDTVTIGAVKFQAMYETAEARLPPREAVAATDTIRKATEATFRSTKKEPPRDASDTTSPTVAAASAATMAGTALAGKSAAQPAPAPSPTTASAAPSEPEQKEGSFAWFDDLTADQAEAPARPHQATEPPEQFTESPTLGMARPDQPGTLEPQPLAADDAEDELLPLEEELDVPPTTGALRAASPPPVPPSKPAKSASATPQPAEWDELQLAPLEDDTAAGDDSLNILPAPTDPADDQSAAPAELEWRVPEPTSPAEADFAFHVEEPRRESQPLPKTDPPKEPVKTDDEDLEEFFKTLDLGGEA